MTALTTPAPASAQPAASPRPVPWRKLAWVGWRQHRLVLAGAGALLGSACLVMLINGLAARASLRSLGLTACHPVTAPACATSLTLFQQEYSAWVGVLPSVLLVVPGLIGAFVGGPLLAREFEAGTFRFAWTQGAGRTRLVVAKLVLLAIFVTAGAGLLSLMFSWWYQPFFAQGASLMTPTDFTPSGVALAAWTLAAFAIAALAGAVVRRTVPAMAAGLAAWAGLFAATQLYLRAHYQAALIIKGGTKFPAQAWGFRDWFIGPDGQPVAYGTVSRLIPGLVQKYFPPGGQHHAGVHAYHISVAQVWQLLSQHGYTHWASYQPESRFWPFQLIEGGWLLALALLLGAATTWLVRRRAS